MEPTNAPLDEHGRIRRQDFYALDQFDEARARFEALRAEAAA